MLLRSFISSMKSGRCNSFPTGITFISFSFLITLATTMSTKSNRNDKNRHPCHIPRLKGNSPYFWPVSIKLVMNFVCMLFIRLIPLLVWGCLMCLLWVLNFFLMIFLHLCSYGHMMFAFCPLGVLIDFQMITQTWILEINSTLSWCLILFRFCRIWFASICWIFLFHYTLRVSNTICFHFIVIYFSPHERILLFLLLPAWRGII